MPGCTLDDPATFGIASRLTLRSARLDAPAKRAVRGQTWLPETPHVPPRLDRASAALLATRRLLSRGDDIDAARQGSDRARWRLGRLVWLFSDRSRGTSSRPARDSVEANPWPAGSSNEPSRPRGGIHEVGPVPPIEALRVFSHCRELLREELGAGPSPELEALFLEIIRAGQ